jgi:hypothetical protein
MLQQNPDPRRCRKRATLNAVNSTTSSSTAPVVELPPELIEKILRSRAFDLQDLARMATTSKLFHEVYMDEYENARYFWMECHPRAWDLPAMFRGNPRRHLR